MGDQYVAERTPSEQSAQYFIDIAVRPATAPTYQRRGHGGGGGAGGGVNGLGGRHAGKNRADVLPRRHHGVAAEASRYVASKPPQSKVPKAGAFKEHAAAPTMFKTIYERGDLPVRVNGGVHKFVRWAVRDVPAQTTSNKGPTSFSSAGGPEYDEARAKFLRALDYSVMLPLFFEGLREKTEPCRFLAAAGLTELLAHADAARVGPVLPLLVLPLRQALNTREPATIRRTITAIQQLVKVPGTDPANGDASVGRLLAPYYRHILPIFNLFKSRGSLSTSSDDYQRSIGEVMDDTMALLAATGGPDAVQEIHRLVPLWTPPPPPPRPPSAAAQARVLAQAGAHKPAPAMNRPGSGAQILTLR